MTRRADRCPTCAALLQDRLNPGRVPSGRGSPVSRNRARLLLLTPLILGLAFAVGCQKSGADGGDEGPLPDLPSPTRPSSGEGVIFTDVTRPAGIRFVHSFGDQDFSNLVEAVGGGVAFFDYDQDGWLDLYLATGKWVAGVNQGRRTNSSTNRLYRNRRNGTFEDVTRGAGVGALGFFSTGVAVGDYDNDGYPDLYVCNFKQSILYRNNGDGTFTDVTHQAGVQNQDRCAVAANWLDFDNDGLLDLYVSNYIELDPDYNVYYAPDGFPGPLSYRAEADRFYRNLGNSQFEDVSEAVGIAGLAGRGMSVTTLDFDQDGYQDIYVTNDATENFLLHNRKGHRFEQVALDSGVGYNGAGDSTASMAVDFGDFDGDGRPDLFVSDDSISSLYRNEGDGFFTDVVVESGIARNSAQFVGWGSFFFDFDNDGDLDIFKVNSDLSRLFGQEDQLFENVAGEGRFRDASERLGEHFGRELLGRGACYADYDNDGDLDVVIVNINSPVVLLRNDGGNQSDWLQLRLVGQRSNRDAIGARVELHHDSRLQIAHRKSASGYLSQSDPRIHFGLGSTPRIEKIEILWPSGIRQRLDDVEANQLLIVEEPGR